MTTTATKILTVDQTTDVLQKLNLRHEHMTLAGLRLTTEYEAERDGLALRAAMPEGSILAVDEIPEKTMLRSLGLSRKFLESCSDNSDLAVAALEQARRSDQDTRLLMVRQDNRLIGLSRASKDDSLVSPMDVWGAIREQEGILGVTEISPMRNGAVDLRVIVRQRVEPARRPGDVTQVGARIHIGKRVTMNPYLFRLVCSNGAQTMDEGAVLSLDVADPVESARNRFREVLELAGSFGDRFIRTDDVVVPNPHEYVMRSLRIAGANDSLRGRVNDLLKEQAPNNTLYEILNIVTSIARESGDRPQTRNRIESIAGRVIEMQAGSSRCGTCNSTI